MQSWRFGQTGSTRLISSNEFGRRLVQHQAVIAAAKKQGVAHLAYTSVLKAPENGIAVLAEHKGTEGALKASGVPYVVLRNGWYIENYTDNLQMPLSTGAFVGAAGEKGTLLCATPARFLLTKICHLGWCALSWTCVTCLSNVRYPR